MRGVPFDRLYQVRDEVVSPLELNIDIGPALFDAIAPADEAVVREYEPQACDRNDSEEDIHIHSRPIVSHRPGFSIRNGSDENVGAVISEAERWRRRTGTSDQPGA